MTTRRRRAAAVLLVLGLALVSAGGRVAPRPDDDAGLRVRGDRLVDREGERVVLHGVGRMGTEYMCVQGRGIFDGPSDQASIDAMTRWGVNAVRVPLNEQCWLGVGDVPAAYTGAAYRRAIAEYVARLRASGLYVILDLHWSFGAGAAADGPQPMPDARYAPVFWREVARVFRSDPSVIFELFNEPYPDANGDTEEAWRCWRDGGACAGVPYEAAGMRTLVRAVRAAGARNVIALTGVRFGNSLTRWLEYRPRDRNLVAAWHTYDWTWCVTPDCYAENVGAVAASVPVVATEIGTGACDAAFLEELMTWLDRARTGYLAWAWNTFAATDCAATDLILDYDGTPSPYGAIYRAHLAALSPRVR